MFSFVLLFTKIFVYLLITSIPLHTLHAYSYTLLIHLHNNILPQILQMYFPELIA